MLPVEQLQPLLQSVVALKALLPAILDSQLHQTVSEMRKKSKLHV